MAKKYVKIGAVLKNKDGNPFIVLGSTKNRDPKYNVEVGLKVINGEGLEVAKLKNTLVSMRDPRTNPNLKEEQRAKIPDTVLYELVITVE